MYNNIFKSNQVTYGRPFQVKIPFNIQSIRLQEEIEETSEIPDEPEETESPELILEKAREEASLIIREAEYEAGRLTDNAYRESEAKARSMEEDAWQKGYAEGLEAAQKQYESVIREAEAIRESAMEEHDQVLAGMESELVGIILDISKKVIGDELAANKENMIYLVRQAIEKCSNKDNVIIKISPEDYEFMIENQDRLYALIEGAGEIAIKQDLSLKQGACIIETPYGNVDAGAQTRIRKIEEAFMEILQGVLITEV